MILSEAQKETVLFPPHTLYGLSFKQAQHCNLIALILRDLPIPDSDEDVRFVARMFTGNRNMFKYMMNNPHLIKIEDGWYLTLVKCQQMQAFHDEMDFLTWQTETNKRMGPRAGERGRK